MKYKYNDIKYNNDDIKYNEIKYNDIIWPEKRFCRKCNKFEITFICKTNNCGTPLCKECYGDL